ncbi:MAG: AsmA-like C-terminal region-containing protein [Chitinophagales bacterium]
MKRAAKIFAGLLFVFVLLLILIPYFFKDKILKTVQTELNKSLNATVAFDDLNVSLIRSFPNLYLGLENLSVVGKEVFKNDTLTHIKDLNVAVNLRTLWQPEKIVVKRIQLVEPYIHAKVLENGKANWDIMIADTTAEISTTTDTESTAYNFQLKKYEVKNGIIIYDDYTSATHAKLVGLNHIGTGNFTQDEFLLATQTNIDALSAAAEGMSYLKNVNLKAKADLNINNANGTYKFDKNQIQLNALIFNFDGSVQMPPNSSDMNIDMKMNAPKTEFKHILSLLPAAYTSDFKDVTASGKAAFNAWVKGIYNDNKMPLFDFNIQVENGNFKYPDLPKTVSDVQLDLKINSQETSLENTTIHLSKCHFALDKEPFDATALIKNALGKPSFDVTAKGKIDLKDVVESYPLEGVKELAGEIIADFAAKGTQAAIDAGNYEAVNVNGSIDMNNLRYLAEDLPLLKIQKIESQFTTQNTNFNILNLNVEKTKFNANGKITNQLSDNPKIEISTKGTINFEDLIAFSPMEGVTKFSGLLDLDLKTKGSQKAYEENKYDDFDARGTAKITNMIYESVDMPPVKLAAMNLDFSPQFATMSGAKGTIGKSDFSASGKLDNILSYVLNSQTLKGKMNVSSNYFDCNEWLSGEEVPTETTAENTEESATYEVVSVPDNLDITLDVSAKKVLYDDLELKNVKGQLVVKDQTVRLNDLKTDLFNGIVTLNGTYNTKKVASGGQPIVALAYDLKNIDIQESYLYLNTMQQLAPVAKYLKGDFSSSLKMDGKLDKNMMPEMMSFSGEGMAAMLKATLENFEPLVMVGKKLNISRLKRIEVVDFSTFFELTKGRVHVKPFTTKLADIPMTVVGSHGLDKTLDYDIVASVPSGLLKTNTSDVLDNLSGLAKKRGIDFSIPNNVDVKIKLTGTTLKPKIDIDYKATLAAATGSLSNMAKDMFEDAKDKATERINEAKEQLEETAKQKVEEAKEQLEEVKEEVQQKLTESVDSVKQYANDKAQEAKETAEKEVKEKADSLLKDGKNQIKGATDSLKNSMKDDAKNKAKDKAKDAFKGLWKK